MENKMKLREVNNILLKMFNKLYNENYETNIDFFTKHFEEMLKCGYMLSPELCNKENLSLIRDNKLEVNKTFYADWCDVTSKTRFELFVDQILHYITTYGTDFEGTPYVPNENFNGEYDTDKFNGFLKNLKVIKPISIEEIKEKTSNMIYSGIALSRDTIDNLITLMDYFKFANVIKIDDVKNKEVSIILMEKLGIKPENPETLLRYIVYKTTDETLLIKSRELINKIKFSSYRCDLNLLNLSDKDLINLSKIFYRYKKIFLAFKNYQNNARIINRIRRLAKKNHVPCKTKTLDAILHMDTPIEDIIKELDKITIFKKLSILQYLNKTFNIAKGKDNLYKIRNGKYFIKENDKDKAQLDTKVKIGTYYNLILLNVIEGLKQKAGYIKYPKYIELMAPSSEKQFVGNIPCGSKIPFNTDNGIIIGAYWHNDWSSVRDYDLSLIDKDGKKIGWNSHFYDETKNIIFSGDMTNAPHGANECIYMKNIKDGIFNYSMNIYSNDPYSRNEKKFKFFIANGTENDVQVVKSYSMVEPKNVIFDAEIISQYNNEIIGFIKDNEFIFQRIANGNSIVSSDSDYTRRMRNYYNDNINFYIPLKELLSMAGFVEVTDEMIEENPDLEIKYDLSNLSKDSIIELLS
jgi:hypothetical protein